MQWLGHVSGLREIVRSGQIRQVVLAHPAQLGAGVPLEDAVGLRENGVELVTLADFWERRTGRVALEPTQDNGSPLSSFPLAGRRLEAALRRPRERQGLVADVGGLLARPEDVVGPETRQVVLQSHEIEAGIREVEMRHGDR